MQIRVDISLAVYEISSERYLRYGNGRPEGLKENEYIALQFVLYNPNACAIKINDVYARIDGGEALRWAGNYSLAPQTSGRLHIYNCNMKSLCPGPHKTELFMNGAAIYTGSFHLTRAWQPIMRYPSAAQIRAAAGKVRSPYIVFDPQFRNVEGITEYAIDFWVDDMDDGTYVSTMNWSMDLEQLKKKYDSFLTNYASPGRAYCGFQRISDGKMHMIMSVWDVFCKCRDGSDHVIRAKQVYPADGGKACTADSGEGYFQQYISPYPWEARHAYRMLMQQSVSRETGNTVLTMFVCDLVSKHWKKLVAFDLGYYSRYILAYSVSGFLENYLVDFAGSVRNLSIANIRGRDARTGQWTAVKNMRYRVNADISRLKYTGSYSFGSDGSSFFIITSGVPGLCPPPDADAVYAVQHAQEGDPYS